MSKFAFSLAAAGIAAAVAVVAPVSSAQAATTVYSNQGNFSSALGISLTDTFSGGNYPTGFAIVNNATMSGYFGQTQFQSTGFTNWNILNGNGPGTYCAGCNGSFRLTFTSTSVGSTDGVFGVGLNILNNSSGQPYFAHVTFGDLSTASYALTSDAPSYYGITSDRLIRSIHFAPSSGNPTTGGGFAIDNLTIGAAAVAAVPEPATWGMMILGFGLVGGALRRRKAAVRVTYA